MVSLSSFVIWSIEIIFFLPFVQYINNILTNMLLYQKVKRKEFDPLMNEFISIFVHEIYKIYLIWLLIFFPLDLSTEHTIRRADQRFLSIVQWDLREERCICLLCFHHGPDIGENKGPGIQQLDACKVRPRTGPLGHWFHSGCLFVRDSANLLIHVTFCFLDLVINYIHNWTIKLWTINMEINITQTRERDPIW